MSKGKTEDAKYLLIKAKHESGEFFHVTATVVTRNGDEVRCVTDGPLEDLTVSSQGNDRYGTDRQLYAWEVDYRSVYAVDMERAEGMVRTLKAVGRSLEKQKATVGRAESFAAYMLRVGVALGVAGYVVRLEQDHFFSGWRWINAEDAHYHITHLEREWREAGKVDANSPVSA